MQAEGSAANKWQRSLFVLALLSCFSTTSPQMSLLVVATQWGQSATVFSVSLGKDKDIFSLLLALTSQKLALIENELSFRLY